MKKIFFAACMAGIFSTAQSANGQTWNASTVSTSTSGNCNVAGSVNVGTNNNVVGNIGLGLANPTDARLHIENSVFDNAFSSTSIPEFKIQRNTWALTLTSAPPNIFEIWKTDYANTHLPSTFHGPNLLDVINNDGKMGILYPTPVHSLDVGGNVGINEGDLYMLKPSNDAWRNIFAQSSVGGLALYTNGTTYDGPAIMMTGNSASSYAGDMRFFDGSGSTSRFVFGKPSGGSANGTMVEQVVIDGNGDISMPRDNDASWRVVNGKADHGALVLKGADDGSGTIELYGGGHTDRPGRIQFICDDAGEDPDGLGFNFINYDPVNTWQSRMRIYKNGKVAIGAESMNVATSYDYGLYVEKGVLTSRLKVAVTNSTEWSDYVFADNYKLKPLSEVASYIGSNKHLPGVPSADDVVKNGVDMAQMDATLLKKIEELTLYSIQQQKQIDQLQSQVKALLGASANGK